MELEDSVETLWRVVKLNAQYVGDDDHAFEDWSPYAILSQEDIGELVLSSDEYQDDQSVVNALLEQGYTTEEDDLNVDGDDTVLQVTNSAGGCPRYTLVRDRRT